MSAGQVFLLVNFVLMPELWKQGEIERRERKGRKEHGAREREEGHGAGRFWATQWKRHDQESAQEACANTQIHAMCSQVLENRHVGKAFSPHSNSLTYFACK